VDLLPVALESASSSRIGSLAVTGIDDGIAHEVGQWLAVEGGDGAHAVVFALGQAVPQLFQVRGRHSVVKEEAF
jgi:hypothetical protein